MLDHLPQRRDRYRNLSRLESPLLDLITALADARGRVWQASLSSTLRYNGREIESRESIVARASRDPTDHGQSRNLPAFYRRALCRLIGESDESKLAPRDQLSIVPRADPRRKNPRLGRFAVRYAAGPVGGVFQEGKRRSRDVGTCR
jgi:hypothetical protein